MKTLLFVFVALISAVLAKAQSAYYNMQGDIYTWTDENGKTITYKFDGKYLYNAENSYADKTMAMKDGSPITTKVDEVVLLHSLAYFGRSTIANIIFKNIPESYREYIQDEYLSGLLLFNSQTGKLEGVKFDVDCDGFNLVPPEVYWTIEKAMKNDDRFRELTKLGKSVNYVELYWNIHLGEDYIAD